MSTPDVPATGSFTNSYSFSGSPTGSRSTLPPNRLSPAQPAPGDAVISYTHAEWDAFVHGVTADEFDSGNH
ncbi:MAG: DUF397 domain-containing protein [Pseudonocardiaceae bacterium]